MADKKSKKDLTSEEESGEVAVATKHVLSDEERKAKKKKTATVITYIIAFLCLVAGFLAPFYGKAGQSDVQSAMLVRYVPDAINVALGAFLATKLIPVGGWFLSYPLSDSNAPAFKVYINGTIEIDVYAWLIAIYAVITVLAFILLFPVIFGKRMKGTSRRCAFVAETLALIFLGVFVVTQAVNYKGGDWYNFNVLIAFGGVLLMTMIQSIMNKGCTGTAKVILFLLSAVSLMLLLDVTLFIPAIKGALSSLSSTIASVPAFTGNLSALGEYGLNGFTIVDNLINGRAWRSDEVYLFIMQIILIVIAVMVTINLFVDMLSLATGSKYDKNGRLKRNSFAKVTSFIRYLMTFVASTAYIAMLVILRLAFGKYGYNEVIPGLYLYAFEIIAFVQLIVSIVRIAKRAKKAQKDEEGVKGLTITDGLDGTGYPEDIELVGDASFAEVSAPAAEPYAQATTEQPAAEAIKDEVEEEQAPAAVEETAAESAPLAVVEEATEPEEATEDENEEEPEEEVPSPVIVSDVAASEPAEESVPEVSEDTSVEEPIYSAATEESAAYEGEPEQLTILPAMEKAEPATQERTIVYNYRTIYNGPTDKFMNTLTDEEKVEFVQTFIEKKKGNVDVLPAYQIGGSNEDFFPSVFIHINRFRDMVSPSLLAKISDQIA